MLAKFGRFCSIHAVEADISIHRQARPLEASLATSTTPDIDNKLAPHHAPPPVHAHQLLFELHFKIRGTHNSCQIWEIGWGCGDITSKGDISSNIPFLTMTTRVMTS